MEKVNQKIKAAGASMKRYVFTFHLEDGVAFGGKFECWAFNRSHAWALLRQSVPGAFEHVKDLIVVH